MIEREIHSVSFESAVESDIDFDLFTRQLREQHEVELTRVLDLVCRDSRLEPHRYLNDSLVPHGGE